MRRPLTNQVMLADAKRRLADHLETRPATRDEAAAIRRRFEQEADWWEAESRRTYRPRTAGEIGRGPGAIEAQHHEGRAVCESVRASLYQRNGAQRARMDARAWECDGDDMTDVWERTRSELEERVDYYHSLVAAEGIR